MRAHAGACGDALMRALVLAPAARVIVAVIAVVAVVAVVVAPAPARAESPSHADEVLTRLQCTRCHDVPRMPAADPGQSCVRCHQQIESGEYVGVDAATLARWQKDIVHLVNVPSLEHLDGRVRRAWIESFLRNPDVVVRPALSERMPRLPIDASLARTIAKALVPNAPDERPIAWPAGATVDRGRALFVTKGCNGCHVFADNDVRDVREVREVRDVGVATAPLAPDLRHARVRMPARAIEAWLREPQGAMPLVELDDDERLALTRYLVEAPLRAPTRSIAAEVARLPLLERAVRYDEVDARVFRRSCWHCHSDASLAGGDGGPGNTGGLGYRGKRLSFASYTEVNEGSIDVDGNRRSIFAPVSTRDHTPLLVAHLLARRAEERGKPVRNIVGMPLGLPSMTPEQLQLVESWIAQGRPR